LIVSSAEDVIARMRDLDRLDPVPREIVLELNTSRQTSPIFWPGRHHTVQRPDLTRDRATSLFKQIAAEADDVRLTIAGVGDPLLSKELLPIIESARRAGIAAIHVETDLVCGDIAGLARSEVDVVSFHVPGLSQQTYANVMGVDHYTAVLENVRAFVAERAKRCRGVPILVPTFTKCRGNLAEMEAWYDQWLRALGAAVINGPSDFAGQIPDVAIADMSPPRRTPCRRLWSRLVIQSDGTAVACEQDFAGRHPLGNVAETSIKEIWQKRLSVLRADHRGAAFGRHPLCNACREWHRC
jgi:spiro-SPASM protein